MRFQALSELLDSDTPVLNHIDREPTTSHKCESDQRDPFDTSDCNFTPVAKPVHKPDENIHSYEGSVGQAHGGLVNRVQPELTNHRIRQADQLRESGVHHGADLC